MTSSRWTLRCSGVTLRYPGGPKVLDSVDLVLRQGESMAITGPSGSGKTSLLSVLAGLMPARVRKGTVHQGLVQLRRGSLYYSAKPPRVAVIPQHANVLLSRSVVDNVKLGAIAGGMSGSDAALAAIEALGVVGLRDKERQPAVQLSGGERQRVAIARALSMKSVFILADEPTGNLDAATSGDVLRALQATLSWGAGLLVVTHDTDIASGCERRAKISSGRLVEY